MQPETRSISQERKKKCPIVPTLHSLPPLTYSSQSSNLISSAPSTTVNLCVENRIDSYSVLPAALAFLCQGPTPP